MIRVVMIARSTLYSVRGGDSVQVIETAKHLRLIGVLVDIKLTNEAIDYAAYDLIHFFNIIRPADILYHIKRSGKPFVISTILIDYSEYDKFHRKGQSGILFRFLSSNSIEYVKTVMRWLLGKDTLMSIPYLWKGQRRSVKEVLRKAAVLLPNSSLEYNRIVKLYHCTTEHIVVPNGIDQFLFQLDPSVVKDPLLVICAARIEGIKNQLNLIKAVNGTKFRLLIIGSPTPNQLSYYKTCRELAGSNIHFISELSQAELLVYYREAKTHILPSWFETTGLSSLEAAAMGCNVVITDKGDAKEYFGTDAFYCEPGSPESILSAIERSSSADTSIILKEKILNNYTWQKAAEYSLYAYEKTIKRS